MKSLVVAGLFALVLPAATIAQDKPAAPAGQKEHTMTGCLRAGTEKGTFFVETTAEKGPKTIGITESAANLAPHVGHKIDITGLNVPAAEAEKGKPTPEKAPHYMKLSAIKMVAATCP
jgi:hypothetical protein